MLNKEACEKAIDNVARYCSDYKLCMIPPRFELTNELEVLMDLIKEHFDTPPYRFDELKINMWVWDDENEMFILITFIDKQFKKMHVCLTEYDGFNDEYVNVEYTEYFEEGRFFPVTKALRYCPLKEAKEDGKNVFQ